MRLSLHLDVMASSQCYGLALVPWLLPDAMAYCRCYCLDLNALATCRCYGFAWMLLRRLNFMASSRCYGFFRFCFDLH